MAVDYSSETTLPVTKRPTPSGGGAYQALQITLPPGATQFKLDNPSGKVRYAFSGTDGSTLTDYVEVPSGSGDVVSLLADREGTVTRTTVYLAAENTTDEVGLLFEAAP